MSELIKDKTQYAYVVTREGDNQIIPCAIFKDMEQGQDTVDAYNQLYEDQKIEGFVFKLHMTAFYD